MTDEILKTIKSFELTNGNKDPLISRFNLNIYNATTHYIPNHREFGTWIKEKEILDLDSLKETDQPRLLNKEKIYARHIYSLYTDVQSRFYREGRNGKDDVTMFYILGATVTPEFKTQWLTKLNKFCLPYTEGTSDEFETHLDPINIYSIEYMGFY